MRLRYLLKLLRKCELESGVATPLNPRMVARTQAVPVVTKWHWTPLWQLKGTLGDQNGSSRFASLVLHSGLAIAA